MTQDSSEDFYYITSDIIRSACKDHQQHNASMNNCAKILFFSLCLRKRFDKNICFVTTPVLTSMHQDKNYKDTFEKNALLNESLTEDEVSYKISDGIELLTQEIATTLSQSTVKAGECSGKVKIVVTDKQRKDMQILIDALKLPVVAITDSEASIELKNIHDALLELSAHKDN